MINNLTHIELSQEPIVLNADDKQVALKKLRDIQAAAYTLADLIENDRLSEDIGQPPLYIIEALMAHVSRLTGIETESRAHVERRSADLRAANMRVRELEKALGASVSTEHVWQGIARLADKMKMWWRKEGLGFAPTVQFNGGCCHMELSCSLSGDFALLDSPTPVSDKRNRAEWLQSLRELGFVIVEEGRYDANLVLCESTMSALNALVKTAFPTSRFGNLKSHCDRNGDVYLRGIDLYVYSWKEIDALPDVPPKQ